MNISYTLMSTMSSITSQIIIYKCIINDKYDIYLGLEVYHKKREMKVGCMLRDADKINLYENKHKINDIIDIFLKEKGYDF